MRFETPQSHASLRARAAEDLEGEVAVGEDLLHCSQGLQGVDAQPHALEEAAPQSLRGGFSAQHLAPGQIPEAAQQSAAGTLDGEHPAQPDQTVIVEGDTITGVGSAPAEVAPGDRVFDLTDTPVSRVMTRRSNVVAVSLNSSLAEILEVVRDKRLARLPVYVDDVSKTRGILLTKDLLRFASQQDSLDTRELEAAIKPAYFVPPGKTCGTLLQEFQQERGHMAIVLDEDGEMLGIVTMQDLLDELFEPVSPNEDTLRLGPRIERLAPGVFRVPAKLEVSAWNKMMMPPIPDGDSYNTVAGYIFHLFGRLPKKGESIRAAGWVFSVTGLDGTRLTWLTAQRREGGNRR